MNNNCEPLPLEDYKKLVNLEDHFQINKENKNLTSEQKTTIIEKLHLYLCSELAEKSQLKMYCEVSSNYDELRAKIRALLTVRAPVPLPDWFTVNFDKILQSELLNRALVDASELPTIADQFPMTKFKGKDKCVLWRGDISLLKADAIVNAANSAMLGCFIPFHKCIDNIIHSRSGPQLRDDCNIIMKKQDYPEKVGWAKITRGYNLPSKYVIHTVGPDLSIENKVTKEHEKLLEDCYHSCLDEASNIGNLKSLVFCGISTGVFAFPNKLAAEIAIKTVEKWLINNPDKFDLIVFDVYSETDFEIYKEHFEN